MHDPSAIALSTVLGERYRLDARLGSGAFGAVFRALDLPTNKVIALKVIAPDALDSSGGVGRFHREAELVSRLTHPNSVRVFGSGVDARGWLFIAFEWLEGRSLEAAIAEDGPFSPRRASEIAIDVLRALEEAHARGIVHRDIKPANIFLCRNATNELVKLLDFGLAKSTNPGTRAGLTAAGTMLGTPLYMAPEQVSGDPITPKTDLFALGIVIAELLYGRPIYEETDPLKLMTDRLMGVPVPIPAAVRASLLGPILSRATSLDPSGRPATAAEMRVEIETVLPSIATSAPLVARQTAGRAAGDVSDPRSFSVQSTSYDFSRSATVASASPATKTPATIQATVVNVPQRSTRAVAIAAIATIAIGALASATGAILFSNGPPSKPKTDRPRVDASPTISPSTRNDTPVIAGRAPFHFFTDATPIPSVRKRDIPPGDVSSIVITHDEADVALDRTDDPQKRGLYVMSDGFAVLHSKFTDESTPCPVDLDSVNFGAIPRIVREAPGLVGADRESEILRVLVNCVVNENHTTKIIVDIGTPGGLLQHEVEYDKQGNFLDKRSFHFER